jgi:hypothetical protein
MLRLTAIIAHFKTLPWESILYRQRGMNPADDQRGEFHFSPLEAPSVLCPPQAAGNSDLTFGSSPEPRRSSWFNTLFFYSLPGAAVFA